MFISERRTQSANAYSLIVVTEEGKITWVNDEHSRNACGPIVLTESGIINWVNDVHLWKDATPKDSKLFENKSWLIPEQPSNE